MASHKPIYPHVRLLMLRAERREEQHRIHPRYYAQRHVAKMIGHTIKIVHVMGSEGDPRASY